MWQQFAQSRVDPKHLITIDENDDPANIVRVIGDAVARGEILKQSHGSA